MSWLPWKYFGVNSLLKTFLTKENFTLLAFYAWESNCDFLTSYHLQLVNLLWDCDGKILVEGFGKRSGYIISERFRYKSETMISCGQPSVCPPGRDMGVEISCSGHFVKPCRVVIVL